DLELQAALPGLRCLTRVSSSARYRALRGALGRLFDRRPGLSGGAAAALGQLEGQVRALHASMREQRLAREAEAGGAGRGGRRDGGGAAAAVPNGTGSSGGGSGSSGARSGGSDDYGDDDEEDDGLPLAASTPIQYNKRAPG
ncbi:hypothetical protein Agub_g13836, partial [Astrephomene gubernaculifera]